MNASRADLEQLRASAAQACRTAREANQSLLQSWTDATGMTVDHILALAPQALGMPIYSGERLSQAEVDFSTLPSSECATRLILPLREGHTTLYALSDPWDNALVQWLSNRIGRLPRLALADALEIRARLENAQSALRATDRLQPDTAPQRSNEAGLNRISLASIERTDNTVVRLVDSVIYDAWKSGASDIHFECHRDGLTVKFRLDGVLIPAARMAEPAKAEEVISRIKVLSQLDITERRVPQDGRFRVRLAERDVDFRVSIMPSVFGEDAVVRLLDKTQLRGVQAQISLDALGFDTETLVALRKLAHRPHGMLLVTGPTGSGKTTTLYAVLSELHSGQEKIITIEDPVEYELPGVLQIPVNEKKGLTFAKGLRSILRHDPDRILVGEIRDAETAEIAVQAALTGHLVFTTVHANSVYDVVGRFLHMDVDLYSLMSALNGVAAQRLVRLNCAHCARPVQATEDQHALLMRMRCEIAPDHLLRGVGCEHCRGTGYKGRAVVGEVLPIDDKLRGLVVRRADIEEIKTYARSFGRPTLEQQALNWVLQGKTTFEEIERVVAFD